MQNNIKYFHFQLKAVITSLQYVSCRAEFFFIKCLISKKCLIAFIWQVYIIMNSFIFFFMIHEATQYRQYRRYRQHKGNQWTNKDEEEIILTNYIVSSLHSGEKKSVCLCRVVFCKACSFEVFCPKKMSQKRENTWIK